MKVLSIFAVWFLCIALVAGAEESERVWKSVKGVEVRATYIGHQGETIILKLADGKQARIPFKRFCSEDKDRIREIVRAEQEARNPQSFTSGQRRVTSRAASQPQAPAITNKLPFAYAKVSPEIKCEADATFSYHMYVPAKLKHQEMWPVMYVFDPGGGKARTLKRYTKGADLNGFALIVSVQSANSSKHDLDALLETTVEDSLKRFPLDPKRMYASGHSGGSRTAGYLGEMRKNKGFAGLLANGAGVGYARIYDQSSKSSVYALCGTNCFNRWDLPATLEELNCRHIELVFFPGKHDWASADLLAEGMTVLNGWFLSEERSRNGKYSEERDRYAERILKKIEEISPDKPGKAAMFADLLNSFVLPTELAAKVRKQSSNLRNNPKVRRYKEAEEEMERYVRKYFARAKTNEFYNRADPKAAEKGNELAEEFADTPFAPIFTALAKPSVGG